VAGHVKNSVFDREQPRWRRPGFAAGRRNNPILTSELECCVQSRIRRQNCERWESRSCAGFLLERIPVTPVGGRFSHQIRKREHIEFLRLRLNGCNPIPKTRYVGPRAPKVHGMAAGESVTIKCRYGSLRGVELGESLFESIQLGVFEEVDQVQIATKLRRAVNHAGRPSADSARHSSASKKGL